MVTIDAVVPTAGPAVGGFETASRLILDYLDTQIPMGFWSITRVENGRQTYLYLDDNAYGLQRGGSHPWEDSYCVRMIAGLAPRVAPDAAAEPAYAAAGLNRSLPIRAYAGAPITEADGSLFGAICGIDPSRRPGLSGVGPTLELLAGLLTVTLTADRALDLAESASRNALTEATTDALTGIHNRRGWDDTLAALDRDYQTYADPTVVVVIDLDDLKRVNDGPGGHAAGDQLLRTAATTLRGCLRDRDFVARLGGDEFGVVLRSCPASAAPLATERIAGVLAAAEVSASLGWAPLSTAPDAPDGTVSGAQAAVAIADQAMYRTKTRRRAQRREADSEAR